MIQSLFILSPTGEVLIERHFRGVTSRSVCDYFWEQASASINYHGNLSMGNSSLEDGEDTMHDSVPPIMEVPESNSGTLYLFNVLRDGLSYLALCPTEVSPLLVIEFLHRVADIFVDYFGSPADESAIKENFSTVYQLLEEMVDNGWPLTLEPNALKAMIRPPTVMGKIQSVVTGGSNAIVSDALPSGTISNMPWRATGVKYSQNEIYVDIVEEIDAIVDVTGNVVSLDVSGSIECQSHLTGIPDLMLTFKDPEVIDDCSFHPCVRYSRYELDGVVSFVPPDGDFQLMRYRVRDSASRMFNPPIHCNSQWTYGNASSGSEEMNGRLILDVSARSVSSLILSASRRGPLVLEDVTVVIPFPKIVRTTKLTVTVGTVVYNEASKIAKWTIGNVDMQKKPRLEGSMVLNGEKRPDDNRSLSLSWKIPLASVSGLTVSGLSIVGEPYKPYKGVRNITRSGRFQVRCN